MSKEAGAGTRKPDPKCKRWPNCDCIVHGRKKDCEPKRSEYGQMMEVLHR